VTQDRFVHLSKTDPFQKFYLDTLLVALDDCRQFWRAFLSFLLLSVDDIASLYEQCLLQPAIGIFTDLDYAKDAHFHFLGSPPATHAKVYLAMVGALRNPVGTFMMYEENEFREDPTYLPLLIKQGKSEQAPPDHFGWLLSRAETGHQFALHRLRTERLLGRTIPEWVLPLLPNEGSLAPFHR
jgi:hypothetical protein